MAKRSQAERAHAFVLAHYRIAHENWRRYRIANGSRPLAELDTEGKRLHREYEFWQGAALGKYSVTAAGVKVGHISYKWTQINL